MEKKGINKHIDEIIDTLKTNDDLMKLIYYDDEKWFLKENLTSEQKDSLLYNRIFPYRFIPKISKDACTYLNIGFGNFRESNNVQCEIGKVTFFFVSHTTLWKTDFGLRPVNIFEQIIDTFKNVDIGLRNLKLIGSDEYWINNDYVGYYITYELLRTK